MRKTRWAGTLFCALFLLFTNSPVRGATPEISGVSFDGQMVIISGSNFNSSQGSSTVTVNGMVISYSSSWSNTYISVFATWTPNHCLSGTVFVTVLGVQSNTASVPAASGPCISTVSTQSAIVGTEVTFDGYNFGSTPEYAVFPGGGGEAAPAAWTNTSISYVIPHNSYGTASVLLYFDNPAPPNGLPQPLLQRSLAFTVLQSPGTNLIIGGYPGNGSTGTYEIINDNGVPISNGSLSESRSQHTATLLDNGDVFIAGGLNDSTSWEIRDYHANLVSSGTLTYGRVGAVAAAYSNGGDVLLVGGEPGVPTASPETWESRLASGAALSTGNLVNGRTPGASAVTLQTGGVWISGGTVSSAGGCSWEIWSKGLSGTLDTCFPGAQVQVLQNGNVMLIGGDAAPGSYEIRNSSGGLVKAGSLVATFNHGAASVVLQNGNVFVFGSCEVAESGPPDDNVPCGTYGSLSTWEILDQNGNSLGTGDLLDARDGAGAVVLENGNVLITGGNLAPGSWEIRNPSGGFVGSGNLLDARGAGHTLTHFRP